MSEQAPQPSFPPPPPPPTDLPYAAAQQWQFAGPVGKVRSTGVCMLLYIVTLGIYGLYWWYSVHDEMKRHSGQGMGGGVGLVLAVVTWFGLPIAPFFTSDEVGKLYQRIGRTNPVSALTGLWYFPGLFLVVLPLVWFAKTNGALNDYWRSQGAA